MKVKILRTSPWIPWLLWGILGLGTGFLNGLLGAAGGVLLITLLPLMPALPAGRGLPAVPAPQGKEVYMTGLRVILPVTLASAATYYARGTGGDLLSTLLIALPAMLGGFIGARLMGKLSGSVLQKIFGGLMLFSGIRMLV